MLYKYTLPFAARPEILVQVNTKTQDGVHYQSVVCSAVAGRPQAQLSWLVKGVPVLGDPFTVNVSDVHHSNGTSSVSSVLRFPTYLQDEDTVSCLVQHPTFQEDRVTAVAVETYSKIALCVNVHQGDGSGSEQERLTQLIS